MLLHVAMTLFCINHALIHHAGMQLELLKFNLKKQFLKADNDSNHFQAKFAPSIKMVIFISI